MEFTESAWKWLAMSVRMLQRDVAELKSSLKTAKPQVIKLADLIPEARWEPCPARSCTATSTSQSATCSIKRSGWPRTRRRPWSAGCHYYNIVAAESSTGINVNLGTTEIFAESMDAMVYCIGPQKEDMNIAYPNTLFDGNIIDKRAMMSSVLKRMLGNNQGMGDVEYWKIYDIYFPPAFLRFFDSKAINILDMWRILGCSMTYGGLAVGTIIGPKLGLQPKPFGEACYACWQGGDFIKIDEPQDVDYTMIDDIYFPPAFLRFFGGPANNILDRWRIFGRSVTNGGLAVGTIIQPELGLQLTPFGVVCYDFWLGGDYNKNRRASGKPGFLPDD